jgi:steroid 5-alpha reductase family enzyme
LGAYLWSRKLGTGEDFRYASMRKRVGDEFWIVSLATVFGLQAVLMWLVSWPVQWAVSSPAAPALGFLDLVGFTLWAIGLAFEVVGDLQLVQFKADPANAGKVLDTGLWRYTRHPNYFGDATLWWGFGLIALLTPWGWATLLGPLVMTLMLLKISGVAMLEKTIATRRPGYEEYVRRTSAFVPRPPRRPRPT